jgi:hypothetical protein
MKKFKGIFIFGFSMAFLFLIITSFSNQPQKKEVDVVILKLMGKKLESAYYINAGNEVKVRKGLTGDEALEDYLYQGYEIKGTSVAADSGRFSIVYTLVK